jgi:hypothetical protein
MEMSDVVQRTGFGERWSPRVAAALGGLTSVHIPNPLKSGAQYP